jgi:hypothetical protein
MEGLKGKTVLLVTHQVDFLPAFDTVLVISFILCNHLSIIELSYLKHLVLYSILGFIVAINISLNLSDAHYNQSIPSFHPLCSIPKVDVSSIRLVVFWK